MRTVLLFLITISLIHGDHKNTTETITQIGEGTTRKGQLIDAYCKAMLQVAKNKIADDVFVAHNDIIYRYIKQNWREYWVRDERKVKLDERRAKVKVVVNTTRLLTGIHKHIPAIRLMQKLRGIKIAVVQNPQRESSSFDSSQTLITHMRDHLGKHFHILDQESAEKLRRMEAKTFALQSARNYRANIWREFDEISVMMDFAVTHEHNYDEALGHKVHHVRIFSRGIERMTAQQLFHFDHLLVGNNLQDTIKKCSEEVTQKIVQKMALRHTVLPPNVYELKFVHFTKTRDRRIIRSALSDLKNKKFLRILEGGTGAGKNYFTEKVRWLKTQHSLPEIIDAIREYCSQVEIESHYHNSRTIVFQPPGSDWDGAPDEERNTLEKNIIPPSQYDTFLQLEQQKFTLKPDERFNVKFRWPQHAPQDWYFYALYFANSEMVYLIFPNGNTRNKLLVPGKDYTFPDVDEYLEEWGIELFVELPDHFTQDQDQILLLATAKPVSLFAKKLTTLEEGGVAVVEWSELEELRNEVQNIKEYAHKVIEINIKQN